MLAANHMIVSGVVGSYIGDPFLAFLVGIILHFILDALPHYDTIGEGGLTYKETALILIDFLVGLFIIFFIMHLKFSLDSPFIWGAVGGMLLDLLDNIPLWEKSFRQSKIGGKIHDFHELIQSGNIFEKKPIPGILFQYVIIALFVWLYFVK